MDLLEAAHLLQQLLPIRDADYSITTACSNLAEYIKKETEKLETITTTKPENETTDEIPF